MLEIISGIMFGLGLAMFEWGIHQKKSQPQVKPKSNRYVGITHPTPVVNSYEECLEDLMYNTGMSDEELDEVMPDIMGDIEDLV